MLRMLRAAAIAALALALAPAAAGAADSTVGISNFTFSPAAVTVNRGDTVTWRFSGPDTNHTVTARPGQADTFESDPGVPEATVNHSTGDTFAHTFNVPGTFSYLCRVHPGMTGTVRVPFTVDTTPPSISSLRAKLERITFRLSESARVTALVKRGGKTVKRLRKAGRKGANTLRFSDRGLVAGARYSVTATARDALGNESKPRKTSFSVPG